MTDKGIYEQSLAYQQSESAFAMCFYTLFEMKKFGPFFDTMWEVYEDEYKFKLSRTRQRDIERMIRAWEQWFDQTGEMFSTEPEEAKIISIA